MKQESMSLKYEPASVPQHISVNSGPDKQVIRGIYLLRKIEMVDVDGHDRPATRVSVLIYILYYIILYIYICIYRYIQI